MLPRESESLHLEPPRQSLNGPDETGGAHRPRVASKVLGPEASRPLKRLRASASRAISRPRAAPDRDRAPGSQHR
jgi:hypothetical protein